MLNVNKGEYMLEEFLFEDFDILMEDWPDSNQLTTTLEEINVPIRGMYILDGAETLEEAAEMAREYANYLDALIKDGYILIDPVENDFGLAIPIQP